MQILRFMDDYLTGKDYIDPAEVKDGGVTREHVRRWKLLQELQVCQIRTHIANVPS